MLCAASYRMAGETDDGLTVSFGLISKCNCLDIAGTWAVTSWRTGLLQFDV